MSAPARRMAGDGRWLLGLACPEAPRVRVVACPPAGGHPAAFRPLAGLLGADVELQAVHPPGRLGRLHEPPVRHLPTFAAQIAGALPDDEIPLALLGHSFGAYVALELARLLRDIGRPVGALVLAAAPAPAHRPQRAIAWHELGDQELVDELRRLGGVPSELWRHRPLIRRLLPGLRADLEAFELHTFSDAAPLPVPTLLLHGERDPLVSLTAVLAWSALTAVVSTVVLPAGHFLLDDARAESAEAIAKHLTTRCPTQPGGRP